MMSGKEMLMQKVARKTAYQLTHAVASAIAHQGVRQRVRQGARQIVCGLVCVSGSLLIQSVTTQAWGQGTTREPLPNLEESPPTANPNQTIPPTPTDPTNNQSPGASEPNAAPDTTVNAPTVPSIELSNPEPPRPGLNPQQVGPFGRPESALDPYRLGPGDGIFVSVQRFPDLSFEGTLDLQGNIIVPIQGAVSFEGLSLEEAELRIRQIYNQYVVIRELNGQYVGPPDVTLTLIAQRGVEVTILGEVLRPGFYPLNVPSVSTALLAAGGATNTSDLREILIQRRLRDGRVIEETIDLFTPLKEGEALPDIRLENGDVMIVPRLDPSEMQDYDRYLIARSTLAQPEIRIRFINYSTGTGGTGGSSSLGILPLPNGSTFVDALGSLAVSPDRANLNSVALIRFEPETGRAIPMNIDARGAFRGDITQDIPLQDNDVIIVGRSFIGRITYALNTITQPFQDVLSFLLFFDSLFTSEVFR
jgi:polysaccharide biosynthesis/export protein